MVTDAISVQEPVTGLCRQATAFCTDARDRKSSLYSGSIRVHTLGLAQRHAWACEEHDVAHHIQAARTKV